MGKELKKKALQLKAAIFNSRQSAFPLGNDKWIQNSLRAVEYLAGRNATIITSLGMNTWELVLACASRLKAEVIIVLPDKDMSDGQKLEVIKDFRLDSKKVWFINAGENPDNKSEKLQNRDKAIADLADLIIPVSIRPDGNMENLIRDNNDKIFNRYKTSYTKVARKRPKYDNSSINPMFASGQWLVHFTRSSKTNWPGMTTFDYYMSVLSSGNDYCQSAANSLKHILDKRIIYGSSKNIADSSAVVGFTRIDSNNIGDIFRYRARLINPNFEPYGIAVSADKAKEMDIYPVIYGDKKKYELMESPLKPFFQSKGRDGQWQLENEWRRIGNFHLRKTKKAGIRVVVPYSDEIEQFEKLTSIPVVALS